MRHYIIDGNNVIHKVGSLIKLLHKDKQLPREKLAIMIESFFQDRKAKITIHYDGFENLPIKTAKAKIIYSNKKTADDKIRQQIEDDENARNIIVVTSDDGIKAFARKCGCQVIASEDFIKQLESRGQVDEEAARINSINNSEYFKKIFKADKS
ncbi:MAG: NYN domain-containing protein [Ignavibacteriaceae bacterium]|nr:NYN domain-containing protein [Ignavibacteriaceae bacterium]